MDVSAKATISDIKLSTKFDTTKNKEGDVVEREIITVITLECKGIGPGHFNEILIAHRNEHEIQADIFTSQLRLPID